MDQKEFLRQQAAATERMRRMHERSQFKDESHSMPPTPDFVRVGARENMNMPQKSPAHTQPKTETKRQIESPVAGIWQTNSLFGDNFLTEKLRDPDTALILGLLLLLFSENADRRLLFALLYILM